MSWMTPIIDFLMEGKLPSDQTKARKLKLRAGQYTLIGGTLYKRSFTLPYLSCLASPKEEYVCERFMRVFVEMTMASGP